MEFLCGERQMEPEVVCVQRGGWGGMGFMRDMGVGQGGSSVQRRGWGGVGWRLGGESGAGVVWIHAVTGQGWGGSPVRTGVWWVSLQTGGLG